MTQILKLHELHGEKWGEKVKIVGISNDRDIEGLVKNINDKGYTKINHYFSEDPQFLENNKIDAIPHMILVDTNGQVVFTGYPEDINLENSIENLVKGEAIPEIIESEILLEAKYKDLDFEQTHSEFESFIPKLEAFA